MADEIKVSVIVPVCNAEDYLDELIFSLRRQTLSEMEFIFINDGSVDESKKVVEKYAQVDSRIKLINKENKGVSSARNDGMNLAKGKYVAFVDADDFVSEKMYECLYNKAEEMDAEIVSCGYMIYQNGKETPCLNTVSAKLNQEEALQDILENKLLGMSVWNKLFRRHVLNGVLFEEKYKINEDRLFLFSVIKRVSCVAVLPDTFYYYRVNMDSVSHTKFNSTWMDALYVAIDMKSMIDRKYKDLFIIAEASVVRSAYSLLLSIYKSHAKKQFKNEYNILVNRIKETKLLNIRRYVGIRRFVQMLMIKYFEWPYSYIKTSQFRK